MHSACTSLFVICALCACASADDAPPGDSNGGTAGSTTSTGGSGGSKNGTGSGGSTSVDPSSGGAGGTSTQAGSGGAGGISGKAGSGGGSGASGKAGSGGAGGGVDGGAIDSGPGKEGGSSAADAAKDVVAGDGPPPGTTNTWEQLTLPNFAAGDVCQSVVDPVNTGTLYTACGNNDGRKIKWYKTIDYGNTWSLTNSTAMGGNPWGVSIDPNPNRAASSPATLYSPAGYGSLGAWKSTDGAVTWTRLAGADAAFSTYNPFGTASTDLYHTAILPDDPPNHVLATYHYGFKDKAEGGFGESWDGGTTWVIHPPAAGMGTSHYVLPISATTWCVISQEADNGVWRTTTAGRVGGTAGAKYRDGTISTAAWTRVSQHAHIHGSYTPVKVGSVWYSPGLSSSEGSIWKSTDDGATWPDLVTGYYWPSPPNAAFMNKNATALAATANYIFSSANVEIARAPVGNDTDWRRNYTTTPAALNASGGATPLGAHATFHTPSGKWMVFLSTYSAGVWRYIEP